MGIQRKRYTTSKYHTSDYRNIAIPKELHKKLAHLAIDQERSVSEIVTELVEKYVEGNVKMRVIE